VLFYSSLKDLIPANDSLEIATRIAGWIYELNENCRIQKGDVVVDVGANIGVFANASYYKGASRILCFEPNTIAFNCLIKNKPENAELFKCAIGDGTIAKMYTPDNPDNTMCTTRYYSSDIVEYVPMLSINDLFNNNIVDHIDFLKIDAEGSENEILLNIIPSVYEKISKISVEFHSDLINNFDPVIKLLKQMGFQMLEYQIPNMPLKIYNLWK